MTSTRPTFPDDRRGNKTKPLLCEVTLLLLYDYNVIAKETKTIKLFALIRGFLWKYNVLFHLKRDFLICDA
jgi:hypothetical protein